MVSSTRSVVLVLLICLAVGLPNVIAQFYNGTSSPIIVYSYTNPAVSCSNSFLNLGVLNENLNLTHLFPLDFYGATSIGAVQTYDSSKNVVYTNIVNGANPGLLGSMITTNQFDSFFTSTSTIYSFYPLDSTQFGASPFNLIDMYWTPNNLIYLLWLNITEVHFSQQLSISISTFSTTDLTTSYIGSTPLLLPPTNYQFTTSAFQQQQNIIYFMIREEDDTGTINSFNLNTNTFTTLQKIDSSASIWNCTYWDYNSQNDKIYSLCSNPEDLFLSVLNTQSWGVVRVGSGSITNLPSAFVWPQTFVIDPIESLAYFSWTANTNPTSSNFTKVDLTNGQAVTRQGDSSVPLWFAYAPGSVNSNNH